MSFERMRRAAHVNVGRRGAALLILGAGDLIYGVSLVSAGAAQNATSRWFATIAPLYVWCAVWLLVAAFCFAGFVFGFFRPRSSRHWAFAAAIGIKMFWLLMCLVGYGAGEVALGAIGVWLGLTALVALIAGWREPFPPEQNAE